MPHRHAWWEKYSEYLVLGVSILFFGIAICLFYLEYIGFHYAPVSTFNQAGPQVKQRPFPIASVFAKLGGKPDASYEAVSWNGHNGFIISGPKGERLFCNYVGNVLVAGDIVSDTGENITRKMAGIFNARTLFDTIAISSLARKNISELPVEKAAGMETPPVVEGEAVVSQELFNVMEKLPSFDLAGENGPVRMIMFTWESCPSCSAMKNIIAKKNLPFRVLEVPTGGNPKAEREALEKLNPSEQDKVSALNRIKDAALILFSMTGKVAVPTYAWQMPGGEIRFGFMPAQEVIDRLEQIAKAS